LLSLKSLKDLFIKINLRNERKLSKFEMLKLIMKREGEKNKHLPLSTWKKAYTNSFPNPYLTLKGIPLGISILIYIN